ncbi:Octopine transport system permease protein OccM [Pseudovibrio axinellae]|uniref:Octopine transport system permease protein OccM n=1 Tax=Pseudovibrio axinellae TaxID=989403 RepID=A0A165XS39_9HYPH|nr:ABC transporter permease subunit [Pseudovibrio axinellae]KZL17986.1 Octopine transport system permease protein OccM [Pseudovibrio axinellae]SER14405.1 amino acid ABC transporter membrane protein 2, PAAT family [Pseudovibrio axinellae]
MIESFEIYWAMFLKLLAAAPLSIFLTAVAGTLGLIIGGATAIARLSSLKWIAAPAESYSFMFRGTPALVQIYLIYYGLGEVLPDTWVRHSFLWKYLRDGLWYAILALSLNQGAYLSEVFKGAIKDVPKGLKEAAAAAGLTKWQTLRFVTLPIAFRTSLPIIASDTIILLKTTSLASTITVMELMGTARVIQRKTFSIYEPLLLTGLIYFAVVVAISFSMKKVEKRYAILAH